MAKAKVRKVTPERLSERIEKLRAETGLQFFSRTIQGDSVYKIVLHAGLPSQPLFGRALSLREAAMAIDMLRLARQLNWHFSPLPPVKRARFVGGSWVLNDDYWSANPGHCMGLIQRMEGIY